jgi:hypothetical protein
VENGKIRRNIFVQRPSNWRPGAGGMKLLARREETSDTEDLLEIPIFIEKTSSVS